MSGLWSLILKVVHAAERKRADKDPQPTAIMDSQSVKPVEESAHPSGYDAHKYVKGRKRHLLVDSMGLLLSIYVTSDDVQDGRPAGNRAKQVIRILMRFFSQVHNTL